MQNLSQFISETREPVMSTAEDWPNFTFVMLMGSKSIQIDEQIDKKGEWVSFCVSGRKDD